MKTYPRARVHRLPAAGHWVIDLYLAKDAANVREKPVFKTMSKAQIAAAFAVADARKPTTEPSDPKVRPCVDCQRLTRPNGVACSDKYPGTVVRVAGGRCAACYGKARKAKAAPAPAPKPAPVATKPVPRPPAPIDRPAVSRPIRLHDGTHQHAIDPQTTWCICSCGWDPVFNAPTYPETRGEATAAVRAHIRAQEAAA